MITKREFIENVNKENEELIGEFKLTKGQHEVVNEVFVQGVQKAAADKLGVSPPYVSAAMKKKHVKAYFDFLENEYEKEKAKVVYTKEDVVQLICSKLDSCHPRDLASLVNLLAKINGWYEPEKSEGTMKFEWTSLATEISKKLDISKEKILEAKQAQETQEEEIIDITDDVEIQDVDFVEYDQKEDKEDKEDD